MRNIKCIQILKSLSLDLGAPMTNSNEGNITELNMHFTSVGSS